MFSFYFAITLNYTKIKISPAYQRAHQHTCVCEQFDVIKWGGILVRVNPYLIIINKSDSLQIIKLRMRLRVEFAAKTKPETNQMRLRCDRTKQQLLQKVLLGICRNEKTFGPL